MGCVHRYVCKGLCFVYSFAGSKSECWLLAGGFGKREPCKASAPLTVHACPADVMVGLPNNTCLQGCQAELVLCPVCLHACFFVYGRVHVRVCVCVAQASSDSYSSA